MPAINSGFKLFTKLRDSGTGSSKLAHILKAFKLNRKGEPTEDMKAEDLLEYISESPEELIPEVTKLKAESFHLYGEYTPLPPPKPDADFTDLEAAFELLPDGEPEEAPKKGKKTKATAKKKAKPVVAE